MKTKIYFKEIDILRGIAISLVILGHAIVVFPIDLHKIPWCSILFIWVSTVHMPLFFLISGFCYHTENIELGTYIYKKIKRLLIPYLLFGGLDIGMRVILPFMVNKQVDVLKALKDILLFGGGYWFLYVLFLIFLIFPLIKKLLDYNKKMIPIVLICLLLLRFTGILPTIFMLDSVCFYLFYFCFGYLLRKSYENFTNIFANIGTKKIVLSILCCLSCWGICIAMLYKEVNYRGLIDFIASIAGIIVLVILANLLKNKKCYLLCEFSRYSLPLYLFNGYFLVVSRTIIITILNIKLPIAIIGFNVFVTLILSWLFIKYIIDRFKIFRFICGMV